MSATSWEPASQLYGPPSFEVWLDSRSRQVASNAANAPDAELDALIASLNAVSIETLEIETEIPVELDGEEASASTAAVVRRVVFEEYATGLESDADVVIVPQLSNDDSNATTYGASSGGDWPFALTTSSVPALSGGIAPLCEHRTASDVSGGAVSLGALLANADYLQIACPDPPPGYEAKVTFSGSATRGSDYRIFYFDGWTLNELLGTELSYTASGGSPTFYLVPVNDYNVEDLESVTATLQTPTTPESGGSDVVYNFTGDASARTATATIIDDDLEFVSDVDQSVDGALPTLESNPIPKNVDNYHAYIFADPDATSLAEDQLKFITPVSALAKSANLLGAIQYSIISGNDAGYFAIDSDTGVVSLTQTYYAQNVANVIENATLQIKARYAYSPDDFDVATVYVNRLNFDIKPYTPQTEHIAPMEIPEENWRANHVGVRRNADFDAGSGNPDFSISNRFDAENDLIKTTLVFEPAYGIQYEIVRTGDALKFWGSSTKNLDEYIFDNNALALNAPCDLWAEYASNGDASYILTLKATNFYTADELFVETVTFRPFTSVTCAFVDRSETPGAAQTSRGINSWAIDRLLDGYDVYLCAGNANGEEYAFDEIINAVNNRGVNQVALVGYRYGGNSVYNLAQRLHDDTQDEIASDYSLAFTAYVDAVRTWPLALAETRRPLGTAFHANYYRADGAYMDDAEDNRDYSNLTDGAVNIDENATVQSDLTARYETKIAR
ncbi:MAG: cadherin repeat domain-containing protein [Thermoguttaceae bacterium]|nr:cadherin repeat domain-containing protein [Thermoguttaceae bacterium]